ncbi:MAG: carboxylating nicotinate-nucleotide diphosphorylase [Planctomycetota bacterium]|jgi:nicotinate-nucleotide pyrophosphorylase (carboxylating)
MLDLDRVRPQLEAALAEDLGPGDVTSQLLVGEEARGRGRIRAKANGVLAGVPVAAEVLRLCGAGIETAMDDGSSVAPGDEVLVFSGPARGLLAGERTALNYLCHLSGVATLTAKFVAAAPGVKILDTRKTTPGLRYLEKYAVTCGGGTNHRYALYDAILVKENHLAFGADLKEVLANRPAGMMAIVEVETIEEFHRAHAAGADVVMVDEFTPEQVAEVAALEDRPLLEVSGGINLDNIGSYGHVDRISIGALTHSVPALDLSMRVEPIS